MRSLALPILAAFALAACATAHDEPSGPPTLAVAAGSPAPAQAHFYVDCIRQATDGHAYDREGGALRFHCGGDAAHAFYDALGPWSAQIHSEVQSEGRVWRFTTVMQHDPSGLDYCWRDNAGGYGCTVVLAAGEFIEG